MNDWSSTALNPMRVMEISSAYWGSSVLHVASSLDVFTHLAKQPMSAEELASVVQADVRGLEMILIACVGLGLLDKQGEAFSNNELSSTFLVKGQPRYQGGIVAMFEEWVQAWSHLKDAVVNGQPVVEKQHDQGEDSTRHYIMGMLHRGIPQAELLAQEMPLTGKRHLLDVGGGPGIFSIIFCKQNNGLKASVFDLPQTLKITKEIIQDYQAEDAVNTVEGSYLEDSFGSGYDAVLLSSMINQEGPDVVEAILRKSFDAMESGGQLLLQEQLLNSEKTGPLLPVLIGLNQLVHTPAGKAYSAQEMVELAQRVGFVDVSYRELPPPSPFTLVTATKP